MACTKTRNGKTIVSVTSLALVFGGFSRFVSLILTVSVILCQWFCFAV